MQASCQLLRLSDQLRQEKRLTININMNGWLPDVRLSQVASTRTMSPTRPPGIK